MLRTRLLTAAVALPFLAWTIFLAPDWFYKLVVLFFTFVALREFAAMALDAQQGATTMVTLGGMTIALAMGLSGSADVVSAGIVVSLVGVLLGTLATARSEDTDMQARVHTAGQVLLGCLYGGLLLPHFISVRFLPEHGQQWVFFVLGCVMAGDAGGYFGGRAFGKRPLWPSVSPNKTIEGALASFAGSLAVGFGINVLVLKALGPVEVLLVAGAVNILAQVGDLLESMVKRAYGAEDSGWLIPGHGGVLDRTDSLVLPIVFVYYYAILSDGYLALP